jgi:hypothetical protein
LTGSRGSSDSVGQNKRYRLLNRIAQDTTGSLWEAEDTALRRPVAVKVFSDSLSSDQRFVNGFRRQLRTAFPLLEHPGVVQVINYNYGEDGSTQFIVMEPVQGETLAQRLERDGSLRAYEALAIAADVADALGAAHQLDLTHGGLSPENVLITRNGEAKLLDFGVAGVSAGLVSEDGQGRAHLSPERASGGEASAASDVYSFANLLYSMLAGPAPEKPDGTPAGQVSLGALEPLVGTEVVQMCERALDTNPESRPSMSAFSSALRRALQDGKTRDGEAERLQAELEAAARLEAERLEAERIEAERAAATRLEAERLAAERLEAEQQEAARMEAERREAERLERQRLEAERADAARLEAERLAAERIEAERAEAARVEAERREAARAETEQREAKSVEIAPQKVSRSAARRERREEKARLEAVRKEAERVEAEQETAARLEAERLERERLEAERLEAERLEAERLEAERQEAARREAARKEVEREEAARQKLSRRAGRQERREEKARLKAARREEEEAARAEAARAEAARKESERQETERIQAEQREAERLKAARLEAERAEVARVDAERREAERQKAESLQAARQERARRDAEQKEIKRQETARRKAEREASARERELERARESEARQALREEARQEKAKLKDAQGEADTKLRRRVIAALIGGSVVVVGLALIIVAQNVRGNEETPASSSGVVATPAASPDASLPASPPAAPPPSPSPPAGSEGAIAVPNLAGLSALEARARLVEAGLGYGGNVPIQGTPGVVIRSDPASGERVAPGTLVKILVGADLDRLQEEQTLTLGSEPLVS